MRITDQLSYSRQRPCAGIFFEFLWFSETELCTLKVPKCKQDKCFSHLLVCCIVNAHIPTSRYGQYLTHAHNHITRLVAAIDSCFALIGLIRVMVLRMCKVLAIPQSRSQSPRGTLVQRNKSNTDSGNEIGHTAEVVRVPQCLHWCGMFFSHLMRQYQKLIRV